MSRKQSEMRKQELINIAMRQFIMQGYDKTSIRSIVGEAEGEIGMFYHHFASKEEIYKVVLEQYNAQFIINTKNMVEENENQPFSQLFERILSSLESALSEYKEMNIDMVDTQMLTILHQNTLISLQPIICDLIDKYSKRGEVSTPPGIETGLLAQFLLFGISAVIHDKTQKSMKAKNEAVKALSYRLLGINTVF